LPRTAKAPAHSLSGSRSPARSWIIKLATVVVIRCELTMPRLGQRRVRFHCVAGRTQSGEKTAFRGSDLLQTHDCMDGDVIPLTQEFLGQMLGVRRTTVTIAPRLLQSAGLIRYRRGHIQILDRKALEDIACECYAVERQNVDKVFTALRSSH
jgi:CRP-like cAMP-binding protein